MEKVLIGLAGVVSGAALTIGRELLSERRVNKQESQYLAIRIVCILDSFIEGCVAVVGDDGTYHGQTNADGCCSIQEKTPVLDLHIDGVNWRSLLPNLMYEILSLPNQLADTNHVVDTTFDIVAMPPSYDEGFEERQYQYALLGLKVSDLVSRLRIKYDIPTRYFGDWNPLEYMEKEKLKIEELRNKRHAAFHAATVAT